MVSQQSTDSLSYFQILNYLEEMSSKKYRSFSDEVKKTFFNIDAMS